MGPFLAPDLDLSFVTAAPPLVAWDSSEIQALDSRDSSSWPYDMSLVRNFTSYILQCCSWHVIGT